MEPHNYIDIESDSCSECEYTGRVNVDSFDSDYEPGDLDWGTELTDDTFLELSGDELEENMHMLKAECAVEADLLTQTTAFKKIATGISSAAWKRPRKTKDLDTMASCSEHMSGEVSELELQQKSKKMQKKLYVNSFKTEQARDFTLKITSETICRSK
ncbi:hypothetical protein CY34DRAFT_86617 [Suillus luteus UH-Slu-Lm8-n1]|uniref:Uncharacterized protein n=1 Tax=Suillus luteus UH-Slu-Lm8-n1 TaxID=930992 RepID=A0A0D0ARU2_9AGAM|nr:hypothetical protein CY34DRAFT_86617 [Suillus luteus UH-Slu-Lm8-n1]